MPRESHARVVFGALVGGGPQYRCRPANRANVDGHVAGVYGLEDQDQNVAPITVRITGDDGR